MTERHGTRYLTAADVTAMMPPLEERLALARTALIALVSDADLPPKNSVHPRPDSSFGNAMPAYLRGLDPNGIDDLLGMKWVVGFPGNAELGLPQIHGTVLLSDPRTGVPAAILDAGPITAERTAAVTGICLEAWCPRGRTRLRVSIIGAGTQARSHLAVLSGLLPGSELAVYDRHPERARAIAEAALASGFHSVATTRATAAAAVEGADVVLTMVSFGADRQLIPEEAFGRNVLVIAVDYDMCLPAGLARNAGLFLVDEARQYRAFRQTGLFVGYPDPDGTIGEWLGNGRKRPDGPLAIVHIGVGLTDVVFAHAIVRAAEKRGVGVMLSP